MDAETLPVRRSLPEDPASVVLGPVWRWVNPVRWVHILIGQRAFIVLSDPLRTGADWLGLRDLQPDANLIQPTLDVVLAHDPRRPVGGGAQYR